MNNSYRSFHQSFSNTNHMRKFIIPIVQMRRLRNYDYMWSHVSRELWRVCLLRGAAQSLQCVPTATPGPGLCLHLADSGTVGRRQPCPNGKGKAGPRESCNRTQTYEQFSEKREASLSSVEKLHKKAAKVNEWRVRKWSISYLNTLLVEIPEMGETTGKPRRNVKSRGQNVSTSKTWSGACNNF